MNVRSLCLGILTGGDATGYEIKKQCEEGPFAHFYAAGFGSIYPALNALCDEGLVSVREINEPGRPARKIYTITSEGKLAFAQALSQPPAPDRLRSDFLFISYFGHVLPPSRIDQLIDERLAFYDARIGEMRACAKAEMPSGAAFTLGYGIAIYSAAVRYLEEHRHELVGAALRSGVDGKPHGVRAGDAEPDAARATGAEP